MNNLKNNLTRSKESVQKSSKRSWSSLARNIAITLLPFILLISPFYIYATYQAINTITLECISQNASATCKSPIEYREPIEWLARNSTKDVKVSAKKLLDILDKGDNTQKKINLEDRIDTFSTAWESFLATCSKELQKEIGNGKALRAVVTELKALTSKGSGQQIQSVKDFGAYFQQQKLGSLFDKYMNEQGHRFFSMTSYDPAALTYFDQEQAILFKAYTERFLVSIKPYLTALFKQAKKKAESSQAAPKPVPHQLFFKALLLHTIIYATFIEDICSDPEGAKAWVTVTKALQASSFGDAQKSAEEFATNHGATIFALQEAGKEVVKGLCQQNYTLAKADKAREKSGVGSIVLFKKGAFTTIRKVKITPDDVSKAEEQLKATVGEKDLQNYLIKKPANKSKLYQNDQELALYIAKHLSGDYFLVGSFHADSKGDNLILGLELIDWIRKREEQQLRGKGALDQGSSLQVIIGTDGNTSQHTYHQKDKRLLDTVDPYLTHKGWMRVVATGKDQKDQDTAIKTRTHWQTQPSKAGKRMSNISDFIIIRDDSHISLEGSLGLPPLTPGSSYDHRSVRAKVVYSGLAS